MTRNLDEKTEIAMIFGLIDILQDVICTVDVSWMDEKEKAEWKGKLVGRLSDMQSKMNEINSKIA